MLKKNSGYKYKNMLNLIQQKPYDKYIVNKYLNKLFVYILFSYVPHYIID